MARREFSSSVKLEIIKRANDANGAPRCEGCQGVAVGGEVHHLNQDAMEIDKSEKLTAEDGQFLCRECHKEITKAQAPVLAKVKRIEKAHVGATKPKGSIPKPPSENARRKSEPVQVAAGMPGIYRRFV